ncbi:hypothetical protein Tco_0023415 [Tanacetum coccineum]
MDISAHASMKNVAKCDTWCELQNPVNHQVFERKLRLKPFGRGHDDASTATPSQAGLPAEFKHINKRRKRNLQGFPKHWRETDSKQVPRGKDEKDFEKRVKECLKLSGGKRMGAGDASRSDVERCKQVHRSTRGVDRCGLVRRPKPGLLICPWRCRRIDRSWQRAPSRRTSPPARSLHRPAGTPFRLS